MRLMKAISRLSFGLAVPNPEADYFRDPSYRDGTPRDARACPVHKLAGYVNLAGRYGLPEHKS